MTVYHNACTIQAMIVLAFFQRLGRSLPLKTWLLIGCALAIIVGVWWYGNDRYKAGEKASDARWEAAQARLAQKIEEAATDADRGSVGRTESYNEAVADEKERIDEAIAEGRSPLSELFPTR